VTPPTVVAVKLSATQAAISWEAVLPLSLRMPPVPNPPTEWSGELVGALGRQHGLGHGEVALGDRGADSRAKLVTSRSWTIHWLT
jgi:hypothetical protein